VLLRALVCPSWENTLLRTQNAKLLKHLPEWNVDLDGTFLGKATGCLEELTAGVKLLRFTMLIEINFRKK
jgi:hypothetical protein